MKTIYHELLAYLASLSSILLVSFILFTVLSCHFTGLFTLLHATILSFLKAEVKTVGESPLCSLLLRCSLFHLCDRILGNL